MADHIVESQVIDVFMGEYNHTLDAKGRLIIPSKFREELGDTFVITRGFDGCLFAYDNEEWLAFTEKIRSLPLSNKDARSLARFFLSSANVGEIDKQGRVLIQGPLRDHAGLTKDIVLLGVGNRVEIWDKERYENDAAGGDMDAIAEQLQSIGFGI